MKILLEKMIQKKNPAFQFDKSISNSLIFSLLWTKFWAFVRGLRILFFGKIPKMLFLEKGVRFFNLSNIHFGKFVQLEEGVYLSALGKYPLKIGNNVRIGAYSRLIISTSFNNVGAFIKIGNNVGLGEFAYLGGAGGLEIEADCIIGQYFSCHPENHNFERKNLIRLQGVKRQGIHVGKNCWIGSKVTILDGVKIGDNCVIAAGAVVTKSMPDNCVIGGVPAKVIKRIEKNTKSKLEKINSNC